MQRGTKSEIKGKGKDVTAAVTSAFLRGAAPRAS